MSEREGHDGRQGAMVEERKREAPSLPRATGVGGFCSDRRATSYQCFRFALMAMRLSAYVWSSMGHIK
jgi:hypothetical protein